MSAAILVAGVGNIFQSDDGFGVEVANRLALRSWPQEVEVAEFGIRGVHLAYKLLDGYKSLVLIDALAMGEEPGTLEVMEPSLEDLPHDPEETPIDAHTMSPAVVLAALHRLGGHLDHIYVVGCQPQTLDDGIGLSPAVEGAVARAEELCTELVLELLEPTAGRRMR
jgi:hydrogenase maturation protease